MMKNDRNTKQQVKTIGTGGNVNYSRLKGVFRKIGCMRLSFDVLMAMLDPPHLQMAAIVRMVH